MGFVVEGQEGAGQPADLMSADCILPILSGDEWRHQNWLKVNAGQDVGYID